MQYFQTALPDRKYLFQANNKGFVGPVIYCCIVCNVDLEKVFAYKVIESFRANNANLEHVLQVSAK